MMADKTAEPQKVGEVLKEFAAKVTTSKTKERCKVLSELEQCILDNGEWVKVRPISTKVNDLTNDV